MTPRFRGTVPNDRLVGNWARVTAGQGTALGARTSPRAPPHQRHVDASGRVAEESSIAVVGLVRRSRGDLGPRWVGSRPRGSPGGADPPGRGPRSEPTSAGRGRPEELATRGLIYENIYLPPDRRSSDFRGHGSPVPSGPQTSFRSTRRARTGVPRVLRARGRSARASLRTSGGEPRQQLPPARKAESPTDVFLDALAGVVSIEGRARTTTALLGGAVHHREPLHQRLKRSLIPRPAPRRSRRPARGDRLPAAPRARFVPRAIEL